MPSRVSGPYLNQVPIGFPSFNNRVRRDWISRQAFVNSEVNNRLYANIFDTLGFKGKLPINRKVGISRIRMRCIQSGYGRGIYQFTRLSRMAMYQIMREGWLKKYGLDHNFLR